MNKFKILSILFFLVIVSHKILAQADYYSFSISNFKDFQGFKDTIDLNKPDLKRIDAVVFYLTNEIRKKHKLTILVYEPLLEKSASIHSENMVNQDFFDHINPKSKQFKTPEDRARYAGVLNPHIAENIIQSYLLKFKEGEFLSTPEKGVL